MNEFKSVFKYEIANHLAARTVIYRERTVFQSRSVLREFDDYLCAINLPEKQLTQPTIENWIRGLSGKSHTIGGKVSELRLLCKYLQAQGITVYIPPAYKTRDEYIPYLFSDGECEAIFTAADNIDLQVNQTNPLIQIEFPVALRLLYSCGLRLGETISIQMRNVDLEGGFLKLVRTKNCKQRFVPMSISMQDILKRYCLIMNLVGKPDAYVFPGKNLNVPITQKAVRRQFDRIVGKLGITKKGRQQHERGPCMHCFRHVFAFKSFAQAEAAGRPVDDSIPFLSTYLGHKSLNEI